MKIDDTPVALERGLLFQTCCALSSFFLSERENERCLPSSAVSQHVASSLERSENDALPSSPTKTMPCLQSRASPSEFTTPALPGSQAWHDSVLDMSPVLMRRTLPMSVNRPPTSTFRQEILSYLTSVEPAGLWKSTRAE